MSERDDGGVQVPAGSTLAMAWQMIAPRWRVVLVAGVTICLFAAANLARPIVIRQAIDDGLVGGNGSAIVTASILFLGLAIAAYVFQALNTYIVSWLGQRFLLDLRMRLFSHYQRLSISFFEGESSGRLVSRMSADMNALTDVFNFGFLMVVQSLFLLLGTVIILFLLSWQLTLISMIILPPLVIATAIFRVYSARAYDAVRDRIADVLIHMQETFAGVRVVQAFARERHNVERFGSINELNYEANLRTVRISSIYIPFIEWLGALAVGLILYFGGRGVFGVSVSVGTVAAFIFYLNFIFQPIQQLSQVYDLLQSGFAALTKIFGLLAVKPDVREAEQRLPLRQPVRGEIRFDRVTFGYATGAPVLHDIYVTIEPGQRVALVGPTGAGKSTLAKLMMRFYDPREGAVRLDGVDLRELSFDDLRKAVVMVPQEGFLFSGTVRENILFGRPWADEEEMIAACRSIGVHDFIMALPEGYDTPVSYRGSRLSAGEKQVVSISRAFLADPPVLILDEATSSLDPGSEAVIERAMMTVLAGRTSIVVAHRLSTAEQAERILVVNDGRIIEDGEHGDLVDRGGHYAMLYSRWAEHGLPSEVVGAER